MKNTTFSILRLLETPSIGPVTVKSVLDLANQYQMELAEVLEEPAILQKVLTKAQINALLPNQNSVLQVWERLQQQNVSLLPISEESYPERLRVLLGKKAPPLLTVLGNPRLLHKPSVGFCGSRKATDKGLATALDCAEQLGSKGVNIVSGYAAGVDMMTHRAALECGGTTTLVLAEGIFNFKVKRELKRLLDWEKVAVVSEFLPGLAWSVRNAMQRNCTICALSGAMVLIEAGSTGGSIEAGRASLKMGIPLFAAVYEGMPETATGNQELLGQGAHNLMKNRKTNRAIVDEILTALRTDSEDPRYAKKVKFEEKEGYQLTIFDEVKKDT